MKQVSRGYSLIEILVVISVITLLMTVAGPRIVKLFTGGRKASTLTNMQALKGALISYNMDTGSFPTKKDGLDALINRPSTKGAAEKWDGPYLSGAKEIPADAWGNEFIYEIPPVRFKEDRAFTIISLGADGEESDDDLHVGE